MGSTLIGGAVNVATAIDNHAANRKRPIVEAGERVKLGISPATARRRQFINGAASVCAVREISAELRRAVEIAGRISGQRTEVGFQATVILGVERGESPIAVGRGQLENSVNAVGEGTIQIAVGIEDQSSQRRVVTAEKVVDDVRIPSRA